MTDNGDTTNKDLADELERLARALDYEPDAARRIYRSLRLSLSVEHNLSVILAALRGLWNPMPAPYDKWFLARVEPPKNETKLREALGLEPESATIIVARKMRGDKPNQVRCSKRHLIYTATGWSIPPVMEDQP